MKSEYRRKKAQSKHVPELDYHCGTCSYYACFEETCTNPDSSYYAWHVDVRDWCNGWKTWSEMPE